MQNNALRLYNAPKCCKVVFSSGHDAGFLFDLSTSTYSMTLLDIYLLIRVFLGDIVDSYNCQDKVCHMTSFESGNSQSIKALCCRNMARNKLRGFVKKYWDEFVLWLYQDPVVRLAGNIWISITISLSLFPGIQLMIVQHCIRQWLGTDQVFLSEPMMVSLLMHICVTRLQWINRLV